MIKLNGKWKHTEATKQKMRQTHQKKHSPTEFQKGHPYFGNSNQVYISKKFLEVMYEKQKLSAKQCSYLLKCSKGTVLNNLRKYNIHIRTCAETNKGKHFSPETEFKKGGHYSPQTEFKKGEDHYLYNKHLMKEIRDKISESHKGKKIPCMENVIHKKKEIRLVKL